MNQKKENNTSKLIELLKNLTVIFGILGLSFWAGIYFKSVQIDDQKSRLESDKRQLEDSIERLKAIIVNDSISRTNFIIRNSRYILFNTDSLDLPLLTVSNAMTNPCIEGPIDGCWKTNVEVNIGDIVGIQFYFHNTGVFDVENLGLGYKLIYENSNKKIVCFGGIVAGNVLALNGVAHIYSKQPVKLTFLPEQTNFIRHKGHVEGNIKLIEFNGAPFFKIGTVPSGKNSQGTLVIRFKVESLE